MQHKPDGEVNRDGSAEREPEFVVLGAITREEMLKDGHLVAVPREIAHAAGFRAPVAITRTAFDVLVADSDAPTPASDDINRPLTSRERQELRRVCMRANFRVSTASKRALQDTEIEFVVSGVRLWLHVGPDDAGHPCFTIMTGADL